MTSVATQVSGPSLVTGARASRSTIALKLLMAVSGFVFIGYVLLHMYGNLKAFAGHDAFNEYAHHLRTFGDADAPARGAAVDHPRGARPRRWWRTCTPAWRCGAGRSRPAPVRYQVKKHTGAIPASRLLRWGGVAICCSSSGTC